VGTGLFLLILFALNRPRHADVATQPQPAPVQPIPAPPPPAPQPGTKAPALIPAKHDVPAGSAAWRVIAFTYRSRDAAEKKTRLLNELHPGLKAAVFSPAGQRGYYLVSLGGRMTRDDAIRLQRSARGQGLPRDVYVQNYSD
jgi:hypothetical protein